MAEEIPGLQDIRMTRLPYQIYADISYHIDQHSIFSDNYMIFGGYLGYSVPECRLIEGRSQNRHYSFSRTQALLEDYATQRNGTVRGVQQALLQMNHIAANIIPAYLAAAGLSRSNSINRGDANSEPSHCECPNCKQRYPFYGRHPRTPPAQEQMPNVPHSAFAPPPGTDPRLAHDHLFPNNSNSAEGRWSPPDQSPPNVQPVPGIQTSPEAQRRHPAIGSSTPSLRNVEQNPVTGYNGHIGHSPNSSPVLPRSQNPSEHCYCDKCRLASDPEQTNVLTTITSPPRSACQLPSNLHNDLGRLNISGTNRGTNTNSDNSDANARFPAPVVQSQQKQNLNVKGENKPLCIKSSSDNTHVLGEQPNTCSACRQHKGEGQKRNTWPSDRREELYQLNRHNSSSDGSITQRRNNTYPPGGGDIEMVYSRISFNGDPRQGEGQAGQNSDLNTNELNEKLQNLNNRNNNEWDAAGGGAEGSRQRRVLNDGVGGNGDRQRQVVLENGEFVFVTFSWNPHFDDQSHLQEIVRMCHQLKNAGIRVKIDMDPETFDQLNLNKNDWLDQMTKQAKYVIVCISPTYCHDTQDFVEASLDGPQPDMVQLNARYIFNNLREEYHGNGSRNRRFIPVMFTNSGATAVHIPFCMRSTLTYTYPDDIQNIVDAIHGQIGDEYRLPYRH